MSILCYNLGAHLSEPLWSIQVIEKNTRMRLKIVGTRVDATEIVGHFTCSNPLRSIDQSQFGIATMKEDHLGVIS